MILQISIISSFQGGVILLDSNGESCDGDQSDGEQAEPVECSNNFVFVGAEIKTGKSSIRSKQSKKKVMSDLECIIVVIGLLVEGRVLLPAALASGVVAAMLYCQHKVAVPLVTIPANVNSPIHYMETNLGGERDVRMRCRMLSIITSVLALRSTHVTSQD